MKLIENVKSYAVLLDSKPGSKNKFYLGSKSGMFPMTEITSLTRINSDQI
jgi:hypothetical protein